MSRPLKRGAAIGESRYPEPEVLMMNKLLSTVCRVAMPLLLLAACAGFQSVAGAAPDDEDANVAADVVVTDTPSADTAADPFAVPDGSNEMLIEFIERVANPKRQFTSQEELQQYLDGVSMAIAEASDRILTGDATDQQTIDAIEWKMEALRIRGQLGDREAGKKTDEFLAGLEFADRATVTQAIAEIRQHRSQQQAQQQFIQKWGPTLRLLRGMDAGGIAATAHRLAEEVKSSEMAGYHVMLLTDFCDVLGDTGHGDVASETLDELLPLIRASSDPGVVARLPILEGVNRRINLIGNKIEVSGTLVDGTPLDWDSYRGKVVLVDFWATWCQPCVAEIPNVKENYRKYHDKGFDVVGVSLDDNVDEVRQFVREAAVPWSTLHHTATEAQSPQNPLAVKYGVIGIPRAILVDQQGNVVSLNARGPQLETELRRLLGAPAVDD